MPRQTRETVAASEDDARAEQLLGATRCRAELRDHLELLATAARAGLESMSPQQRGIGFENFPFGACGPVTELMGRIVLERTGYGGVYVCGDGHPDLPPQQSHAWLEVGGFIVDLTHDQFAGTGVHGWVLSSSDWHARFEREESALCLKPSQWMQYPHAAYAVMLRACDLSLA